MTAGPASGIALLSVVACLAPHAAAQSFPRNEACVQCHLELDEERLVSPARDFEEDLHAEAGFGCLDCHGIEATGPASGFLAKPGRHQVASLCGRCHSDAAFMRQYRPGLRVDQVAEYATSVHGQRLARDNDPNVAICVSCHPPHGIKAPSDPESSVHPLNVATTCGACHANEEVMGSYPVPVDQQAEYEASVHWRWMTDEEDLSAPTCNDCHGNHGAAPPGISSVQNVCGQCHSVMMTFFVGNGHADHFVDQGLPGCATCHGNHRIEPTSDDLLPLLADSVCSPCHADDADSVRLAFRAMKLLIDSLSTARTAATAMLEEAENVGMEVSQAQFDLEDATNSLVKARAAVHAFTVDSVGAEVTAGLTITVAAAARGQDALRDHLVRRQGLAVSVVLIGLLIAGLALKIRQLERPEMDRQT